MHFLSVTIAAGSLVLFSAPCRGDSILAIAPVTALSPQYALQARHIGGACPAASQTSCADGLGCCPNGAACTYSGELPVCDELCGAGPKCPNGGCCQAGYFCGKTNNFCTPSPTGIAKLPSFSVPADAPVTTHTTSPTSSASGSDGKNSLDISSPGGAVTRLTATATSTQSTRTGGATPGSSHTPSKTAGRSTYTKPTTTRTGAAGGGVGGVGGGATIAKTPSHTPTPSASGAASSLDATTSFSLLGFGWIITLFLIM